MAKYGDMVIVTMSDGAPAANDPVVRDRLERQAQSTIEALGSPVVHNLKFWSWPSDFGCSYSHGEAVHLHAAWTFETDDISPLPAGSTG